MLARQDPKMQSSVQSLQQRRAARKAAKSDSQPPPVSQQPSQHLSCKPSSAIVQEVSAASTAATQQASAVVKLETQPDMQLVEFGCCQATGREAGPTRASSMQADGLGVREQTKRAVREPDTQKAMRVQSLQQELAAAEAVVSELKAWLADAEAEMEAEGPACM